MPAQKNPRIERIQFALRATGLMPGVASQLRSGIHTRGYLPHVKREGASYFVTFRLPDSLPRQILLKFESEKARRLQSLHAAQQARKAAVKTTESIEQIERDFRRRLERFLDTGYGACLLKLPDTRPDLPRYWK